jgi:uncharacterized protein
MSILTIDGQNFKNMVLSGAFEVISSQEDLNKINVFPVADGDTGSNMAAAFESILLDIIDLSTNNLTEMADHVADAGLNGSRGNSGAILAQFFVGFSNNLSEQTSIGIEKFAESMLIASNAARNAISEPVEGTIITVMHEWANWLNEHWHEHQTFEPLFKKSLQHARHALKRTKKQLKVLAQNHVVDAGAKGFVNFLEGAYHFINKGELPDIESLKDTVNEQVFSTEDTITEHDEYLHLTPHTSHGDQAINFQYCTECIIHGEKPNVEKIRGVLSDWGDSLVIVGGKEKAKIHIHTNDPRQVFRLANSFGEVLESKADDMWAQYRANIKHQLNKSITLVADSSCSLPQELLVKYNIVLIPLQIMADKTAYLDRINLTHQKFLTLLDSDTHITTSQPKPKDTELAFSKALQVSPNAIGILLSSKLSGTFASVKKLVTQLEEDEITLFDSRNATTGLGLIVLEAAKAIQQGQPMSTIKMRIKNAIANCITLVSLSTLKYAIKGGRVKKSTGFMANLLKLLPVLAIDHHGKVRKAAMTFGIRANRAKVLRLALKHAAQFRDCELLIAHGDALKEARSIRRRLLKKLPGKTISIVEVSPVLLTHAGLGAIAVSVLGID